MVPFFSIIRSQSTKSGKKCVKSIEMDHSRTLFLYVALPDLKPYLPPNYISFWCVQKLSWENIKKNLLRQSVTINSAVLTSQPQWLLYFSGDLLVEPAQFFPVIKVQLKTFKIFCHTNKKKKCEKCQKCVFLNLVFLAEVGELQTPWMGPNSAKHPEVLEQVGSSPHLCNVGRRIYT